MTTADEFLESLNEIGIKYIFGNLGTDHAPILEAMAQWQSAQRKYPQLILCPHENVATAMASGFAQCTGEGQMVLVHTDVGTANAAMGVINACHTRTPLLLVAGKTPFAIHGELPGGRNIPVHFLQDSFDTGSIVRPYVKWEYTLPSGAVVKETVRRAHTVMQSDPKGPVYLMLPREILAETRSAESQSFPAGRYGPVAAGAVDDSVLHEVAGRLLDAENPILITAYSGRNLDCPAILDQLGRLAGIKVFESYPSALNISHDSECFFGFAPESEIPSTDFGMMVDVDVPWIPVRTRENPNCFWVHIDVDVLKKDIPMWGFPSNVRIQGDSATILCRLLDILKERMTAEQRSRIARRLASFRHSRWNIGNQALRSASPGAGGIEPATLCSELDKVIFPQDILINETVRNTPSVSRIRRTIPGTYWTTGGSGLGYGGGAALGAKLANPDRAVVHLTGDGSFYFSNPSAVYEVSRQYGLPIFTVVFDNGGWAAVKESIKAMYPQGTSVKANDFHALLDPHVSFEKIGEAAGAYGESVTEAAKLPEAIHRCRGAVQEGRSAVLVARLAGELYSG